MFAHPGELLESFIMPASLLKKQSGSLVVLARSPAYEISVLLKTWKTRSTHFLVSLPLSLHLSLPVSRPKPGGCPVFYLIPVARSRAIGFMMYGKLFPVLRG